MSKYKILFKQYGSNGYYQVSVIDAINPHDAAETYAAQLSIKSSDKYHDTTILVQRKDLTGDPSVDQVFAYKLGEPKGYTVTPAR